MLESNFKLSAYKTIIKGSLITLILRLLMILSGYIFLYIINKNYGYDFVGNFSLIQAIYLTLSTICVLGFDTLSVKLVPLRKDSLKFIYFKMLLNILPLIIFLSLLMYLFSAHIALFFNEINLSSPIKILSISLFPLSLININCEFFRGMKNMFYYSIYNKGSLILILLFLLLFSTDNFLLKDRILIYYYYLYSIILLALFSSVHLFFKYLIKTKMFISINDNLNKKKLFSLSKNMLIINIVFILFQFIDIILLGLLSSSSDVGIYTIILKISSITSIILLGVNSISGPIISQLSSNNKLDELNLYIKAIVRISTILSIPIIFLIIFYSDALLLLFGGNLLIYKKALYLMCFAQFINVVSGSVGLIMQMSGNEKIFRNIIIFSIIINVILSVILIPKFQVWGAVYSSSFSLILWNILSIIFIKKKIDIYSFIR